MRAVRLIVPAALLVLLGVIRPVRAADEVLVPGKPALTQSAVDQDRDLMEWVFDQKMNEKLGEAHKRYFVALWKNKDEAGRTAYLQGLEGWSKIRQRSHLDQVWVRTQMRAGLLVELCWFDDPTLFDGLLALDRVSGGRPADPDQDKVLVAGTALTRGAVDQFREFVEWAFDLKLTRAQSAAVQDLLIDEARRADKKALEGSLTVVRFWSRLSQLNATDQRLVRAVDFPNLVAGLGSSEDRTDRWLFALYQSAYPVLAEGDPPLTRWSTDAHAELFCFQNNQVAGKEVWVADRAFKDSYGKRLAAAYQKADAAGKQQLAEGALQWETLQAVWPNLSEEEQRTLRTHWAEVYKPLNIKPPTATTLDEARRKAEQAKLEAELERIRHQSVMDSIRRIAPRYNPVTGRYE